uniref:Uncharacterized protein n=1 Tax=Panagrolaimus sp. JU765 TaxID=591449 RepID=A0AC34QCQ9_9BILA
MEVDEAYVKFNNTTLEHRKEMEKRRKQKLEEEEKLPQVEFVNATDIGIHGINSAEIDRPSFRSRIQEHLKEMEELYGPEAERIITRESTVNFKFDQLISKFGPSLWPQIPFKL